MFVCHDHVGWQTGKASHTHNSPEENGLLSRVCPAPQAGHRFWKASDTSDAQTDQTDQTDGCPAVLSPQGLLEPVPERSTTAMARCDSSGFPIPRPSRCALFLPFAEKAIYCVVCSKKSLFLLKVLLQNLAKTWSANVAFWSGNVAFGSGNVAFSSSSWFRTTAKYAKMR